MRADAGVVSAQSFTAVIPTQAGIHLGRALMTDKAKWIPACAGMTAKEESSAKSRVLVALPAPAEVEGISTVVCKSIAFLRCGETVLCAPFTEWSTAMNAFWTSINKLAQGQLFAHGHLSARTAIELANKSAAQPPQRCGGGKPQRRTVTIWPRLAIPH